MHTDPFDDPRSYAYRGTGKKSSNSLAAPIAAVLAAAMAMGPPMVATERRADTTKPRPSKNRDKVKAARKQNRKRRAGK